MTDTPHLPQLYTGRRQSYNAEKHFYILFDGWQRYYAAEHFFPNGIPEDRLVSFTCRPPRKGHKFPAVTSVVFEPETEKS